MARPHKETKVVHRNLNKEDVWGWAYIGKNKIDLHHELKTYRHLLYLIHEKLHLLFPDWTETRIKKNATQIAKLLWQNKYRKVDL